MSAKNMQLLAQVGRMLRRFPEAWQEYQDWLREITDSCQALRNQYPLWQVALIIRWRLLYFGVYVGRAIVRQQARQASRRIQTTLEPTLSSMVSLIRGSDKVVCVLRRLVTLLAVMELTLCAIAALTGLLLAFYYEPTAAAAHASLANIATHIPNGMTIISMHDVAGNLLIALTLVQIVVMFMSGQARWTWVIAWVSGILLTLSAIALSWTAVILDWDQLGFWRLKIELGTIGSIPFVGAGLRTVLAGGEGISGLTFQHMYMLHSYVLAIAALLLSLIHLGGLLCQAQNTAELEAAHEPSMHQQSPVD